MAPFNAVESDGSLRWTDANNKISGYHASLETMKAMVQKGFKET